MQLVPIPIPIIQVNNLFESIPIPANSDFNPFRFQFSKHTITLANYLRRIK